MNVEWKQILKKDSLISKRKAESSKNEKKNQWKDLERQENIRGKIKVTLPIKSKVEGVVQKWFFEKNLNMIAILDQKTCKNKKLEEKLGTPSIKSSWYKIHKCKLSKVRQSTACYGNRLRPWLCYWKDNKVVYFKWTVLGVAAKIVFNHYETLPHKVLFNFLDWTDSHKIVSF